MNLVKDFITAQNELLFALRFGAFHMADDGSCSFHYTSHYTSLKGEGYYDIEVELLRKSIKPLYTPYIV